MYQKNRTYPESLIEELFEGEIDSKGFSADEDRMRGLNYALSVLTPRTKDILVSYYSGATLEELGKRYCLTKERIRQLVQKGLRLLRRGGRIKYITEGFNAVIEREKQLKETSLKEREIAEDFYNLPFLAMQDELDVRTYNCLYRASCRPNGYITIGELDLMSDEEILSKFRNFGRKSLRCVREAIIRLKKQYDITGTVKSKYLEQVAMTEKLEEEYFAQMTDAKSIIDILIKHIDNNTVENRAVIKAAEKAVKVLE